MGRRGPKPEPASVKLAKGNSARRPIGTDPVTENRTAGTIEPPDWLDEQGKTVWARLAPRLVAMKLLSEVDVGAFARYCSDYAMWVELRGKTKTDGAIYTIVTASGTVRRPDPTFVMCVRLNRELMSAEDRFGLNPAERQRIFAARAVGGAGAGDVDLFGHPTGQKDGKKPARKSDAPQATPARPTTAIGLLGNRLN
ncbi:phage terminase small subunit P27 family [Pleomorphomonas oryzae]|uniref:phage terminase small subunit P27 family n=1 Tax=Pleomorphomonas oryzae TaxID=261934 RepID=UPI0004173F6A|nr:phage terminase small subunit P27 family [Pleomorphomonas oryzae]